MKRFRLVIVVGVLAFVSACSGKDGNPITSPGSATTTTIPPSLLSLSGQVTGNGAALAGANVTIADGVNKGQGRVTDGAGNYSFTNLTPSVFTLQATAAGYNTQNKAVTLTAADQSVSFALIKPNPLFVKSGSGNQVFDMPTYVSRVRIQGTWNRTQTSNFIVYIGGRLTVNEILRDSITYDGTHLTSGGVVEIVSSNQITWTFTEIR